MATIDRIAPKASISLSSATLKTGTTATVSIKFSEAVKDFTLSDFKVSYGKLSNLTSSDNVNWTATLTPTEGVHKMGYVQLMARSLTDLSGNALASATTKLYTVITKDIVAPKATITLSDKNLTSGEVATVSIKFTEAVKGFTVADLTARYGSLSNLVSADNINWTATLTPTVNVSGAGYIALKSYALTDTAGNYNASAYSSTYTVKTKDTTPPTAVITLSDRELVVEEAATVNIQFSEAVKGFSLTDLTVSNGTLSNLLTTDNINWTAVLTPATNMSANGSVTLSSKSITDNANNYNTASVTTNFTLNTLIIVPEIPDTTTPDDTSTAESSELASQASAKSKQVTTYQSSELLSSASTIVKALESGDQWSSSTISYSFNTSVPNEYKGISSDGSTQYGNLTTGWTVVSSSVQTVVNEVMTQINQYTGLTISAVASNGDIRFNMIPTASDVAAFAYYPGSSALAGDVFIDTGIDEMHVGGYGRNTITHELGHALGLKHPFEDGITLPVTQDHAVNTIMSYTQYRDLLPEVTVTKKVSSYSIQADYDTAVYPSAFMVYDIATLQAIYGVDTTTNTGDNVYRYGTTAFYDSIWDAGGVDTIDLSATTASNTVKLVSGSYSTINYRSVAEQIAEDQAYAKAQGMSGQDSWIATVYNNYAQEIYTGENALGIAFGAIIENVKGGSAADTFYDNAVDNVIYGGSGDDVFYLGAGGYDTLYGETGVDKLILSSLAKSSVQLEKQATGETFLLASNFAVKLVGIETIQFSDQTYTV